MSADDCSFSDVTSAFLTFFLLLLFVSAKNGLTTFLSPESKFSMIILLDPDPSPLLRGESSLESSGGIFAPTGVRKRPDEEGLDIMGGRDFLATGSELHEGAEKE